jgi:hypothetical protein
MIKKSTDTRKLFNFYTYDPTGRDVVIPVRGADQDDAWNSFDKMYRYSNGALPPVDQVIEVK